MDTDDSEATASARYDGLRVFPSVLTTVARRDLLESHLLPQFAHGGFFMPGHWTIPLGEPVCIDVVLGTEHVCLQQHGIARWRRERSGPGHAEGIGVEFLETNSPFVTYLSALARGTEGHPPQRRSRRFHVRLPVDGTCGERTVLGTIHDISETGAMFACPRVLARHSIVELRLRSAVGLPAHVTVTAEVRWSMPGRGMGLRFTDLPYGDEQRFLEFLDRLRSLAIRFQG